MQIKISNKESQNLIRQAQLILKDEKTFEIPTLQQTIMHVIKDFVEDYYQRNGGYVRKKIRIRRKVNF